MRLRIVVGCIALTLAGLFVPGKAGAQSDRLCFNVPGITSCIEGRFRHFWEQNGGLHVFGYPITPASYQRSRDTGQIYLTQWFERNSFELHPENARPYDVLLGRLSDYRLLQMNRIWRDEPKASGPVEGCVWFAETQHNVCDQGPGVGFKTYMLTHGLNIDASRRFSPQENLALLGLPLTEARIETNSSGDSVLTQWFERARLEWHPNNPVPYKVLLGLLGNELRNFTPPVKTCENPVLDELRRTYEEGGMLGNASFRQALGCPQFVIRDLPAASQAFERGEMTWIGPTSTRIPQGTIYAVFGTQYPMRSITYTDLWQEGQPETGGETPPAGRIEPKRGFGRAWREELGVREGLGWATQPERPDRATMQVFENGVMLWLQDRDVVYVTTYASDITNVSPRIK